MNDAGAKRGAWEADELIESRWEEVDEFVSATVAADDEALVAAVEAGRAAGLPEIQVTPAQGKLLYLLARTIGARRVLEFGTLAGYSTIWLARALPEGGRLVSLESKPEYAEVARANVDRAGLGGKVEIRVGPALDSLPGLERGGALRPRLHRRRQGEHAELLRLGARPRAAGRTRDRRQRRPRRHPRRSRLHRRRDRRPAPPPHDARRGATSRRNNDPDGRGQGLRRLHPRLGRASRRALNDCPPGCAVEKAQTTVLSPPDQGGLDSAAWSEPQATPGQGHAATNAGPPAIFLGRPIGPVVRACRPIHGACGCPVVDTNPER